MSINKPIDVIVTVQDGFTATANWEEYAVIKLASKLGDHGLLDPEQVSSLVNCVKHKEGPRRGGSVAIALFIGITLLVVAVCIIRQTSPLGAVLKSPERVIDAVSSAAFGVVLLWWAFSCKGKTGLTWKPFRNSEGFGIGFETITMAVTVIAAAVAIFTLTHEALK